MVIARNVIKGERRELRLFFLPLFLFKISLKNHSLLKRHACEDVFGVQVTASNLIDFLRFSEVISFHDFF